MYRVGLSSCGFALTEENFQSLAENQITAVELSKNLETYGQMDFEAVAQIANRHGVELWSMHLPFVPFEILDPSSLSAEIRENTVKTFRELIAKGAAVGIDKFVVHPSIEPIKTQREDRICYAMQTLDRLAELAHGYGATVAVEDLPRTCLGNTAEELLRLISANGRLRVVFDTNHLLQGDNVDFAEKLSDRIITLHVSDYDFINERHWLPGEGRVNWNALYQALVKVGYRGVWMYELGLRAPSTIHRECDLTFADFRRNADEIFAGAPLTVLGTSTVPEQP